MDDSKILLVEDEAIVGIEIKNTLQKLGYTRTELVPSAESVFESIEEEVPDLCLMDVNLKGDTDGIEVTNKIHEDHDTAVIFITAYSSESVLNRIKDTEAIGYIVKPIDDNDIESITARVFENKDDQQLNRGDLFFSKLRGILDLAQISLLNQPGAINFRSSGYI